MATKERITIPHEEYAQRLKKIQKAMKQDNLDIIIMHACECESANIRYISNVWTVFDFIGGIVPKEGEAILLTGGPESYDLVKQNSHIKDVRVHPKYVETSAPEWDKPTNVYGYTKIFKELSQNFMIKKIGIANSNIIPNIIVNEIREAAPDAEIVNADDLIMKVRWMKSKQEIEMLREAYRITDQAVRDTLKMIKEGVREWEIEAEWRASAYKMGAEGVGYPIWVTSGPTTFQSLCRSSERIILGNEMIQLTLGAKFGGYCGNLCRPVVVGHLPERHMNMIKVAAECLSETIKTMGPGVAFSTVYDVFQKHLEKEGFKGLSLYGPAHGTGMQECEGPWVDNRSGMVLMPGMVFNIDIWIADHEYGVRFEDGIVITDVGVERLTTIAPEPFYI
ncbi:M24 family metallopeptidase [Robinsoniella peoriensis]|uniref:Putative peptidase n=1 Tax=Robinsoniella peoriensis TaxID=180332 RepID=A0A4U8Q3B0_9FIRM|nr:Xaa-Pro peptidase family protein [Robinsoniella peoriensis]MDU7030561.1 Xaa-Pro peptidase family protein [Clostridiales bacterium]TLC98432.1 putative peptidase [Robinsoniella peoriensis]